MKKCPIHNINMEQIQEELITGKVAKVNYCPKCSDIYIPQSEFKKYDEAKTLKRKLARALSMKIEDIDIIRVKNGLMIHTSS